MEEKKDEKRDGNFQGFKTVQNPGTYSVSYTSEKEKKNKNKSALEEAFYCPSLVE